jgi:hypothetical protein
MTDLEMPLPQACKDCPWQIANHGKKPDPHGFFTKANRTRLWKGLRTGEAPGMTCHGTDTARDRPDWDDSAGAEATHECAGAIACVQRELLIFQNIAEGLPEDAKAGRAFTLYRQMRPGGMTTGGFAEWISRIMFGGTPLARAMRQPTEAFLDQPGVERAAVGRRARHPGGRRRRSARRWLTFCTRSS